MQHAAEQLTMTTLLRAGNAALAAGGMQQFCNLQVQLFEQYLRAGSNFRAFQLRTQRAKAPLQSIEDMISYNAFYGARHEWHLLKLFLMAMLTYVCACFWPWFHQ